MDQGTRKPKQSLDSSLIFMVFYYKKILKFLKKMNSFAFCLSPLSSQVIFMYWALCICSRPSHFTFPLPFMKHKCQSSEKKLKLNTKKKEEKRELKGKFKKNQTKQFGAMAMQIKINSIKLKSNPNLLPEKNTNLYL